jgi:hypothetical protein
VYTAFWLNSRCFPGGLSTTQRVIDPIAAVWRRTREALRTTRTWCAGLTTLTR